mgnify:CR=1 FL=1
MRRLALPTQATRSCGSVGLRGQRPGEDQAGSREEPAVVAVAHHRGLGLLRDAAAVTAGGEVHQANALDRGGVVGQLDVQSLGRAVDVDVDDVAVTGYERSEVECHYRALALVYRVLAEVDGVDLGDVVGLAGEVDGAAVDGELLQGEDFRVVDRQAGYWSAVPHAGLAAFGDQLVVALAVGDDGELTEAVLGYHRVFPADM